jgi:hypothetical protein
MVVEMLEYLHRTVSRPVAASILGCSTKTLQRAEKQGLLDPIKVHSSRVVYRLSEVLRLQEQRKR